MSVARENPAKDQRRREILDAAYLEFAQKGYAGASMGAIARRARASKETLYAWFENKETLFDTLFLSRVEDVTRGVVAAIEGDRSPAHVLPIVARDVIRLMLAIAPVTRAMGAGEPGEKTLRRVGETIAAERARFAGYMLWCRDEGHVAFDDDPLEIVSLFVAMAEGEWILRLATGMLDDLTDQMIEDHAQRVTRIFLKGLAP